MARPGGVDAQCTSVLSGEAFSRVGTFFVRGLYAVTPDEGDTEILVRKVAQAVRGGARLVQYRNKAAAPAIRGEQGAELLRLCRTARVPLIINDDLELSLELDADGVHLGRGDGDTTFARRALGVGKLLGVSCYDSLSLGATAQERGADYVAFGAAYETPTKPGAARAALSLYRQAKSRLRVPIVAIGGITPDNAREVFAAGADSVAVISALFDAPDIERCAREFTDVFRREPAPAPAGVR